MKWFLIICGWCIVIPVVDVISRWSPPCVTLYNRSTDNMMEDSHELLYKKNHWLWVSMQFHYDSLFCGIFTNRLIIVWSWYDYAWTELEQHILANSNLIGLANRRKPTWRLVGLVNVLCIQFGTCEFPWNQSIIPFDITLFLSNPFRQLSNLCSMLGCSLAVNCSDFQKWSGGWNKYLNLENTGIEITAWGIVGLLRETLK